jgi:hypothetical protein
LKARTKYIAVLLAAIVLAARAAEDNTAKPPVKSLLPAADARIPSGPPGRYPIGRPAFERLDPLPVANRLALSKLVTLKKGETAALLDERGAGVLTGLRLTMKPWTPMSPNAPTQCPNAPS